MDKLAFNGIVLAPDDYGRFRFLVTDKSSMWALQQAIPFSYSQSVPYNFHPPDSDNVVGMFWVTVYKVSDAQKRVWAAEVEVLRGATVKVTCKKRLFRSPKGHGTALDFISIEKIE